MQGFRDILGFDIDETGRDPSVRLGTDITRQGPQRHRSAVAKGSRRVDPSHGR